MRRVIGRWLYTSALLLMSACPGWARSIQAAPEIAEAAWLRNHVPADTALYVRIPSPWALYAAPNDGALHQAMIHPAHRAAIAQIRKAFASDPLLAEGEAIWMRLLLSQIQGPFEMALQARNGVLMPGPGTKGVFALTLQGFADVAALNAVLDSQPGLPARLSADGTLTAPNLAMHFDPSRGRLIGMVGMEASLEALEALRRSAPTTPPFAASEARIDQSGHGAYLWMDLAPARPMLSLSGNADNPILQQADALAMGFGTAAGKGRISMEVLAKQAAYMDFLPRENKRYAVRSAGQPSYAAALSLLYAPSEWTAFKAQWRAVQGDAATDRLEADLKGLREALGLGLDDIFAALGPDLLIFSDRTGEFAALRIRDANRWKQLLQGLQSHAGVKLDQRDGIHELSWTGTPATPGEPAPGWLALADRIRQRVYWTVENGYLITANTPQELRDRRAARVDFDLGDWLRRERGAEAGQSLLLINGQTRAAARRTYYMGLGVLQVVADLSGAEIDPLSYASADELGLPMDGSAGLGIEASADRLALVLTYDATGADLLFAQGGGVITIATVGVLAAIALPVYQDYIARAQVAETLAALGAAKTAYAEYHAATGKIPDLATLGGAQTLRYAELSLQDGLLMLQFHSAEPTSPRLRGRTLAVGLQTDGQRWTCGRADSELDPDAYLGGEHPASWTDLADNMLPSACK